MKKDETITIRVTNVTKRNLEKIAENEDRTLSFIINKILENWIKENRPK